MYHMDISADLNDEDDTGYVCLPARSALLEIAMCRALTTAHRAADMGGHVVNLGWTGDYADPGYRRGPWVRLLTRARPAAETRLN